MHSVYRNRPLITALLLVSLVLFFVPALQPLLCADLTCGYDNVFHLWRAVQIDHLWSQGVLYSRWAPDMAHGFGFPLFNFMPPGTALGAALLHRLGLPWPVALNGLFALGMIAGGLFMFCLARDLFGTYAGMVAAVGYVYAPFLAYDVFNRGSLSESVAWAFPPLILWALRRWSLYREKHFLVVGAFGLAALMLSHHLFGFLFAPLLALWVLLMGYLARDWRVIGRGVLLGGLGLGLTAFFWLPPLLERGFVQTERLLGTWVFDYHYNFLSLGHVLALPRAADPALINDWPQKSLGLLPVLLALLPLLRWKRLSREACWHVLLLWLLTLAFTFLVLSPSVGLWERIPLLPYIQFPWRYLGPAAFCLALLAGAGVAADAAEAQPARLDSPLTPGFRFLATYGLMLTLIAANLGWFFPAACALPTDTSPAGMIAWERATDTLGTTAKGEYLPVWVKRMPDADALEVAYRAGGPVARLAEDALPAGATVISAAYGALRASITLETPTAFQAHYLAFYYPGWQVTVDGAPVAVTPEPETGLVTFPVPAGTHHIEIEFGETPLRLIADGLSILSFVLLGIATLLGNGKRVKSNEKRVKSNEKQVIGNPATSNQHPATSIQHPKSKIRNLRPAIGFVAAGLVVSAVKLLWVNQHAVLWRATRLQSDGTIAGVQTPANVNFGGRALLLGYDMPLSFAADAAPAMTLYWRALNPEGRDWRVGLTFIGADGARWPPVGLRDARWSRNPPPLTEWPSEKYARMDYLVDVYPGMPPGDYTLTLSLFDRNTLEPASVLGMDGNPTGPEFTLGQVRVLPPRQTPTLSALEVAEDATLQRCGALGLWAMTADRAQAAPGDVVALRWVWEAVEKPSVSAMATLSLRDAEGAVLRTWYLPPAASWWPTDQWKPGDRWIGRPIVRLPGSLESGDYSLRLGLPGCDELAFVSLRVVAPERRWGVPDDFTTLDVRFGEVIRLAGYTLETGQTVKLTLAWQALAEMETAYRVFVHIVGADGQMLAQSDGEPAGWTRPTPGWAVGEVVLDERVMAIPANAAPGDYAIRVGLYTPEGPRLMTTAGEDAFVIGTLSVP